MSRHPLRTAMSRFATGVAVVTSRRADGNPVATTVNAVTSVSLEPPLLLVCLAHDSVTLAAIRDHGRFAVGVLAAHQHEHSDRFARKGDDARLAEVAFGELADGLPYLPETLTTISCQLFATHAAGDHEIVLGEAAVTEVAPAEVPPLLFFGGSYSELPVPAGTGE